MKLVFNNNCAKFEIKIPFRNINSNIFAFIIRTPFQVLIFK